MGTDPTAGRMHELTEDFVAQRPEARDWVSFRADEVVTLKGQAFTVEKIRPYGLELRALSGQPSAVDPDERQADALLDVITAARAEAERHKTGCPCRLCRALAAAEEADAV